MKCKACRKTYDANDQFEIGPTNDKEWIPEHGRCYTCYLDFCYSMYGGYMEPVLTVGLKIFSADGEICEDDKLTETDLTKPGDVDIPF